MTAKGEGVFALEGIEVTADKGYATFTTGELTNWTLTEGLRYGPAGEDAEVVSGDSYTATAGSDKAYVLAAGTWNAQITFTQEATTVVFTKTGGDVPGPEVTVPETLYFNGNLSGAAWAFNTPMTKAEASFSYDFEVINENGYVTFATAEITDWTVGEGGVRYVPAGNTDENVESGVASAMTVGSNGSWVLSKGKWHAVATFTAEGATVTFTLTGEPEVPEVTVPETLFFNGNLSGTEWVFNTPMTKAEASFSYDFEVAGENGYVTFTTAEMTDWTVGEGGVRYVPAGNTDEAVESGVASAMIAGNDGAWVLASGKWTAVATFTAEGASVTFTRTGDIVVPDDQPLNVTYNFTSLENMQKYAAIPAESEWSDDGNTGNICYYIGEKALVSDGVAITAMKNPDATGTVTAVRMYKTNAGVYDFRANKNNFVTFTAPEGYYFEAMTFSFNTAAKMNVLDEAGTLSLATKKDGNYYPGSFTPAEGKQLQSVTFEPTATCRFATIDITLAKLPDDPEDEYPVLYLRGADNGWGADESNLMTCNKGIYTITLPSLYGAFKIAAADWADENTATTQNMEMALDVTYTVEHPQGGGSNMAMAEPLKDATIVYDSKNNTIQVTGTVDTECAVTYLLHGQFNLYQAPAEEGIMALEEAAWNDIELTENNGVYSTTVVPAAETGSFVVFQKRNGVDYYTLKAAGSEPLTASAGITLSPDSYTDATYSLDPTHKYILALDPTSLQMTATDGGTTGIDGIIVDNTGAEVRYFNLQGVSVANPTPGLYIVVRGGKATKEYIR